jgi:hypothetical protein
VTATDLDPAALLDALHAALDADPSDAVTRLMLADLLGDSGDRVGAQGQRWQALHGRWPVRATPGWRWWLALEEAGTRDDADDLPREVFPLLSSGEPHRIVRYYPSRRAAEADLALALEALAARGAVLAGYESDPCPWCGERALVRSGAENACDPERGGCGRRWAA